MIRRIACLAALGALLAACAPVRTASLSPNDPGYWYSAAPQSTPQIRAPGNERTYRPLGGAVY